MSRLADLFPQSAHVRLLAMEQASDTRIWRYAQEHDFVIVTHDSDFMEWSQLYGKPPKVVWLRCGNATPQRIEAILRANAAFILQLAHPESGSNLEIF